MRSVRSLVAFLFSLFISASVQAQWWKVQTSGIDANLRGVSAAHISSAKGDFEPVVWASGSNGVILHSVDEGKTWQRLRVDGGDALDFRGIVALSARTAYVMSSGEGEKSRIYKTTDGGKTWTMQYTDKRKEFFLDTIACLSETHCYALGDPMDGKFLLLNTTDGKHWNALPNDKMPAALSGEGAFAASNSCLLLTGEEIFFGTGGPAARVFHSPDSGRTWRVNETPIAHGNTSSGIFSIARGAEMELIAVGGDYQDPKRATAVAAFSLDDGATWRLFEQQPGGYRSAAACDLDSVCVAIGPNGEDVSKNQVSALRWKPTDSLDLNAVTILDAVRGWAVGPKGTVARFVNHAVPYSHQHVDRPPLSSSVAE
jgi:photosystem II stability/assembly factor-like uncharacterized protein